MRNPLHKLSIRTLKFFLRFMRRTHELFTGTGVAIVSAALVIGVFMLVWWGIGAVKSAIELRLEHALVERLLTLIRVGSEPGERPVTGVDIFETPAIRQFTRSSVSDLSLVSASFSDLFSGTGWLDGDATTMYRDHSATAFIFEPQFELRAWSGAFPSNDGGARACVGGRCITREGTSLVFGGTSLSLPATAGGLTSVSVGALESVWVVGAVYENNGEYRGELWYFDGARFTKVFDNGTPFVSRYSGTFGVGGADENWLAVYGAYEGIGYQFRRNEPPRELKGLFGIRTMGGGFRPVVTRRSSSWYVWNAEGGAPQFLKLFNDSAGRIIGVTDLTNVLLARTNAAYLAYGSDGADGVLIRANSIDGSSATYRFFDSGFAAGNYTVISSDLNEGRDAEVRRARIARVDLALPSASIGGQSAGSASTVSFYLANKEGEWLPVTLGNWLTFPDTKGKNLFWRADFSAPIGENSALSASSPYFDLIQVEYFLKFTE